MSVVDKRGSIGWSPEVSDKIMRVSIGTAHVLGLKEIKIDALPTTAYLMHGEGCRRNCKFCAQAVQSGANSRMLSRVVWPEFESSGIVQGLTEAGESNTLKRCCIQVVDDGRDEALEQEIKSLVETGLPLCVSKSVRTLDEIGQLLELGIDKVTIALDAINPEVYEEVKGGSFSARWEFLLKAARKFSGRIATHIIVGLGENEEETIQVITELYQNNVSVALFAFTPLRGTPMAEQSQPEEGLYRRIQIAHYLIRENGYRVENFQFEEQRLVGISGDQEEILRSLAGGKAFQTSGCPDCNRPYYNERPGGVIYNYPRTLEIEEVITALKSSGLWSDVEIERVVGSFN